MSAFLVSAKTIDRIVSGLRYQSRDCKHYIESKLNPLGLSLKGEHTLGSAILQLNQLALKVRYGDELVEHAYKYNPNNAAGVLEAIKSFDCLIYQCSEGDVVNSPLYKVLVDLKNELTGYYVRRLPDYDKASWDA